MIAFDPKNPFPLLSTQEYDYALAKQHAILVDRWLQMNIDTIERTLTKPSDDQKDIPQERWIGLDAQSFLTPYIEIRIILNELGLGGREKIIDLGCGYGRMGHVIGRHYPEVQFTGYEIVHERVQEALRSLAPFSYKNVKIIEFDLAHLAPQRADIYFIYDYGSKAAIEKTLGDLKHFASEDPIRVVARGRASRFFINENHPWLSQVVAPRHFETFSIYES